METFAVLLAALDAALPALSIRRRRKTARARPAKPPRERESLPPWFWGSGG
jgi:hypothetical protein